MKGVSEQRPTLIGANTIQDTVRQVLCFEHRGLIEEVAEMLGMPVETVRTQLDSRRAKSVLLDIVRAVEFLTGDRRLGRILAWPGRCIGPDPGELAPCGDIDKEGCEVFVAMGKAVKSAQDAIEDGEVTLAEGRDVLGCIDDVRQQLAEFEAVVLGKCPSLARENK